MRNLTLIAGVLLAACGGSGGAADNPPPPPPPPGATLVSDVQGSGAISPLQGQSVTLTAVVTGDFQDNDADTQRSLGGFYVQDGSPDGDPATSDGIFVFDGGSPATDVDVGDTVEVTGTVSEYFGETQIAATAVRVTGTGNIAPLSVSLPATGTLTNGDGLVIADLEHLEGMLVEFTGNLTVTNLRNLERYGSVTLAAQGRPQQYTNANAPDTAGYRDHVAATARRQLVLDDGLRTQNPPAPMHLTAGIEPAYSLRAGDATENLTGVLRYSRGSGASGDATWRLMPTGSVRFASLNPRPGAPNIDGALRVASFNVLNFFSTVDTGQSACGPQGASSCRGADSDEELARQLDKTVTALAMMDADIVGLMELENNGDTSIATLVDALNTRLGAAAYDYVATGSIHDDAIKTGFLYRTATVSTSGTFALLDRSVDSRYNDARNRPALAQTFTTDSGSLTVVVVHLKSKGSPCDADGDANTGDGQGNCNLTRNSAAAALADWLTTDPTGSGDPDYLVIGDFNAYLREDPLQTLRSAGLTNLLDGHAAPYSFVFDAQAGALDHAFASPSLVPQIAGSLEWHINADEPPLLDYNLEFGRDANLFDAASPYRASDHDPVIVGLDLAN